VAYAARITRPDHGISFGCAAMTERRESACPLGGGTLSETDQDTQPTDRGSGGGVQRPPRVLISYRRADTRGYAGWIYQWLCERFGKASVFKDIDTIKLGQDWRKVI
jgi:hypothetical protein